jgi:prophage tail gpP-like protein
MGEAQAVLVDPPFDARGARVVVALDGVPRLTGVIESAKGSVTRGYSTTIRSITSALAVWQSGRNQLFRRNAGEAARTHADIVASLAAQVGLDVAPGAPQRTVSRFRVKRGETLLSALQRLAAAGTWVLTDTATGEVALYTYTGAGATRTWQPDGHPLLEVQSRNESIVDWRDAVLVRSQRIAVAADTSPESDADADQVAEDFTATPVEARPSQLVISNSAANSKADAIGLALWETARRAGKAFSADVALSSWAAEPGDVVRLRDPANGIDTALIVESMETNLTPTTATFGARLVLPAVYDSRARRVQLPGAA